MREVFDIHVTTIDGQSFQNTGMMNLDTPLDLLAVCENIKKFFNNIAEQSEENGDLSTYIYSVEVSKKIYELMQMTKEKNGIDYDEVDEVEGYE